MAEDAHIDVNNAGFVNDVDYEAGAPGPLVGTAVRHVPATLSGSP